MTKGPRRRSALLFSGLVLVTVFFLAAVWDFLIGDRVNSFLGIENPVESLGVKWELVVMSTLFAAIAMIVTALALGRLSRRRERAEEERFQSTFAQAAVGIALMAPDGHYLRVNPKLCEILGYSAEELGGLNYEQVTYPEDLEGDRRTLEDFLAGKLDTYSSDKRYIRKNGDMIWAHRTTTLIRTPSGEPAHFTTTIEDITEHRQILEELRDSEERYARAVSGTNDGVWDRDLKTGKTYFSPRWAEMLGYTPEELDPVFDTFTNLIHPDDKERMLAAVDAHMKRDALYDVEFRLRRKDGEYCWVRARGRAVRDEDGKPVLMAGSTTDISERKRGEEELRKSEASLANAQRIGRFGNWDWNLITGEVYRSAGIYRIFGTTPEEFPASFEGYLDMVHPEDRETVAATFQGTFDVKTTHSFDYRVMRPDGDIRIVHEDGEVKFNGAGEPEYISGTVRDITESRRAEELLRESEAKLRQAQKMEAVGQLTGGVAHDFNNLLAIILGNLEIARERMTAGDETGKFLDTATRAARRGADLVRRLLAFSRRQSLKNEVLDINERVMGMVDLIGRSLGETIDIRTDLAANLWPAFVDSGEFESLLLNLALNGRDAMPRGGGIGIVTGNAEIEDTGENEGEELEPGRYVRLVVTDTGSGMSGEVLDQAFEPFFTTKEFGGGSGLGLSMAHGFVKQSGGKITIDSEVGVGTRVEVYLPCPPTGFKQLETTDPETARKSAGGEMILVVEDDADVRQLTVAVLASLGYGTVEAAHGRAALEVLDRTPDIVLVFTDIVLPGGMSGAELAQKIRTDRDDDVKILLTSGYPRDEIQRHGKLDDLELIRKPYRKPELARKLNDLLRQGGGAEAGVPEPRGRTSA